MTFNDRLTDVQQSRNSLLCVGLDTDPAKIPAHLTSADDPVFEFNRRIVDATHDLVCAYKLNFAFYEALGEQGWTTLRRTIACIPPDLITIGDAKRGDIGNSSAMYARAIRDDLKFSSVTVNPYLGEDSVRPFIEKEQHGAFILALTSNPGAKDFQYLKVNGQPLYERVVARVKKWNTKNNCGLVVGATRPKELKRIRSIVPSLPLLIPGVGAQGGSLVSAVRYGCTDEGVGAVINASRSVLYASPGADFADAARKEAESLRQQMNDIRKKYFRTA